MINDSVVKNAGFWKFVDESTAFEVVPKKQPSGAQIIAHQTSKWSKINRTQRNPDKCKQLRISFSKHPKEFLAVKVDNISLEVVKCGKLLSLTSSSNLT